MDSPIAAARPHARPRFALMHAGGVSSDFAADVRRGLTSKPKFLLPHYFYDPLGSALFDAICELPEYYVTRAETEILTSRAAEIANAFGTPIRLVELGSGSARKTRYLLDAITARQPELEYVPIDVDASMLEKSGQALLQEYDSLRITAICGDFREASRALPHRDRHRTVVLFLGSTIGNLDPDAAVSMLRDLRTSLVPGDALFLGADLRKSRAILEPAYDDPLGVTAAFNLNLLGRINRELGGHFAFPSFEHRAFYNEELGRIEMHLVSRVAQVVHVDSLSLDVSFAAGESIHTENSYKHDEESLRALMSASGFTIETMWTDSKGWFADLLAVAG
ncbi:MAG TPA: L-histidine N(alpha)-methyltransferase [Thermoanaerobaculia bacterium]|nr:L-histidine N(alpha)-methyltransferase [Thermoanaerobaculia bacterium]